MLRRHYNLGSEKRPKLSRNFRRGPTGYTGEITATNVMRNLILFAVFGISSTRAFAQFTPSTPPVENPAAAEAKKEEIEQGIPIANATVRKSCSPCHAVDEKRRMSRISYRRTTPEGWELTLKRMVSLNGVQLDPPAAREIVKYLSDNLGLAPEEAKPAAFEVEHRMVEFKYTADKDTESTCIKCHSFGRVMLQRRTKSEWELLIAMHRGYYPLSDFQAFRRMGPLQILPGADGRPPDNRHPMEKAIAHLATAFPLKTPEWSAWSANMRTPKLAGVWALSGHQAGKGAIYGQVTITPKPGNEDEFTTETQYVYARTGQTVKRTGRSVVYTGFQWRGRSVESSTDREGMREVVFVDPAMRELTGRWFSGAYQETGIDVRLQRIGNDAVLLGLDRKAFRLGTSKQAVTVHGIHLPANLSAESMDFGRGMKVSRVVSSNGSLVKLELDVAPDAPQGKRDLFMAGATLPGAVVVYDKIDTIRVTPQAGMARVGGENFPKQFQQFEAIAFSNGPDGKPDTKDDLELGPVNVAWSVEEYTATYGDNDRDYVGKIDDNGLFTPNVDGPNPKRKNSGNNVGDVWVVATYQGETSSKTAGKTIRGRAHLLVTVPLFIRYDQAEVNP